MRRKRSMGGVNNDMYLLDVDWPIDQTLGEVGYAR
jgi:hypothetical protein